MFYEIVLSVHSWMRWLVLITLVFAIYRGFKGLVGNSKFKKIDALSRTLASIMVRIQFVVGILLYGVSPIAKMLHLAFGVAAPGDSPGLQSRVQIPDDATAPRLFRW